MTVTLDLPEALEKELAAEAERRGLSLGEYVVRVLAAGREAEPATIVPESLSDLRAAAWKGRSADGTYRREELYGDEGR